METEIYKITFSQTKPRDNQINTWYINHYYSEPDEGYWLMYSNVLMTPEEVYENLTEENLDKYLK